MNNLLIFLYLSSNDKMNDSYIPWLVALVIGILSAIVNLIIADRHSKSNERNLNSQIENSKEIVKAEFNATIASQNRQNWINEIRNELSNLLTYLALIVEEDEKTKRENNLKEIFLSKSKIDLLINSNKKEQDDLQKEIHLLIEYVVETSEEFDSEEFSQLRHNVVHCATILFGIHWKKIKNLD